MQSNAEFSIDREVALDSDPDVKVRMRFDPKVTKKAITYRDSLLVVRKLPESAGIIAADTHVIYLTSMGYDVKEAVKAVRHVNEQYHLKALEDGLRAAIFDSMFTQKIEKGRFIVIPSIPITVPDDYWDDTAENEERLAALLPPLPKRVPFHPVEQRVAYVYTLLSENARLAYEFSLLFEDAVETLVEYAFEEAAVTDGTFHTGDVGGNTGNATKQPRKSARKPRKPKP